MSPERFAQMRDLFERALDVAKPERERVVREWASGDETLVREVLKLLAADAEVAAPTGLAPTDAPRNDCACPS